MPYARLDDQFWLNPKVEAVGFEAAGFYAASISYAANRKTDGLLAPSDVARIAAARPVDHLIELLVDNNLWHTIDGGYEIHDYLTFNGSREELAAEQDERTQKARKAARARWDKQRAADAPSIPPEEASSNAPSIAQCNADQTRPDQTPNTGDTSIHCDTQEALTEALDGLSAEFPKLERSKRLEQSIRRKLDEGYHWARCVTAATENPPPIIRNETGYVIRRIDELGATA